MALSVRLDPTLEKRLEQEARLLGLTKSDFVKDALERVLGMKDPADLLDRVGGAVPIGSTDTSENVSRKMKEKLREKHPR